MSKFVSNKLAKKINSVAADLCVYRTFHGSFQDGKQTRSIDRMVSMVSGIIVTRDIGWGNAAAADWIHGCRVKTGYTASQAKLAHAVLNGLAALHSQIGQQEFDYVLSYLNDNFLLAADWRQTLAETHAAWAREIAELETAIRDGLAELDTAVTAYCHMPNQITESRVQRISREVGFNRTRLEHCRDRYAGRKTPEEIVAKLHAELVAAGILPA